ITEFTEAIMSSLDLCELRGEFSDSLEISVASFRPDGLPLAPPRRAVEAQLVPPRVERPAVAAKNRFARCAGRRRHERGHSVVDARALLGRAARQQMPERQRIAEPRAREDEIA